MWTKSNLKTAAVVVWKADGRTEVYDRTALESNINWGENQLTYHSEKFDEFNMEILKHSIEHWKTGLKLLLTK
jgi:hypothetical protein